VTRVFGLSLRHGRWFSAPRIAAVLVTLLIAQSLPAGSARATGQVDWTGSFTSASAANPAPVLDAGTSVNFVVSRAINDQSTYGAKLRVFDGAGGWLATCFEGTACSVYSNPAPGTPLSYYAEMWVQHAGVYVYYSTSAVVTVTDPGWTGSFTSASAANPTPVLDAGTSVNFSVSTALSSAKLRVFDGAGGWLATCFEGTACSVYSNPAPGTSLTYYAELWVQHAGTYVY